MYWHDQLSSLGTVEAYRPGAHVKFDDIDIDDVSPGCLASASGRPYDLVTDADRFDHPRGYSLLIEKVRHLTDLTGFMDIVHTGGFRGGEKPLYGISSTERYSWWTVQKRNVLVERFMDRAQRCDGFKYKRTPPFQQNGELYGNYSFTFPLNKLLDEYRKQYCGSGDAVLRILGTFAYFKEIQYAVLVHSSDFNEDFEHLPVLTGKTKGQRIEKSKSGAFFWTPESVMQMDEAPCSVWENLSFAFHTPGNSVFKLSSIEKGLDVVPCERFKGQGYKSTARALNEAIDFALLHDCEKCRRCQKVLKQLKRR